MMALHVHSLRTVGKVEATLLWLCAKRESSTFSLSRGDLANVAVENMKHADWLTDEEVAELSELAWFACGTRTWSFGEVWESCP